MINFVIQRAVQRADSASEREWQNRDKSRDSRNRSWSWSRDRDRDENNQTKKNDNQMINEKKRDENDIW